MEHRVKRRKSEVGGQKTEDRRQRAEDRKKAEVRGRKSEGGGLAVKQSNNKPSVGTGSMQCRDHEYDFFVFVDFIEKAPGADSITPGVGIETT